MLLQTRSLGIHVNVENAFFKVLRNDLLNLSQTYPSPIATVDMAINSYKCTYSRRSDIDNHLSRYFR
jgi:hypothetical protein